LAGILAADPETLRPYGAKSQAVAYAVFVRVWKLTQPHPGQGGIIQFVVSWVRRNPRALRVALAILFVLSFPWILILLILLARLVMGNS
jgi:hypothetical protein